MGLIRWEYYLKKTLSLEKILIRNGRKTYTGCAESIKERYVRVAAIIIATIDGIKNNCVQETHEKPVTSTISSTRKDVLSWESLMFRAEPSSINMLQCKTGRKKPKITVQIQINEQLRSKMVLSKETPYVQ